MEELQVIDFFPTKGFNRSVSPHALQPDVARLLQHAEISYMQSRLRRGPGICKTQVQPTVDNDTHEDSTVTDCAVWHDRSGKLIMVYCTADAKVRATFGDGTQENAGPLPYCDERANFEDCCGGGNGTDDNGNSFDENFGEDCGVSPPGVIDGCTMTCDSQGQLWPVNQTNAFCAAWIKTNFDGSIDAVGP